MGSLPLEDEDGSGVTGGRRREVVRGVVGASKAPEWMRRRREAERADGRWGRISSLR